MDEGKGEPSPDKNGKARVARGPELRRPSMKGAWTCARVSSLSSHHLQVVPHDSRRFLSSFGHDVDSKKETACANTQIPRPELRSLIIAEVASPQWHSPQKHTKKKIKSPTTQKPSREGSPKTIIEDTRLSSSLSLDPVHPLGTSDLGLPRLATQLCDSPIPSALRRRLRRYVMAAY